MTSGTVASSTTVGTNGHNNHNGGNKDLTHGGSSTTNGNEKHNA